METLLEIRDLSVTFQDVEGTRAARHVNLQLKKGELAALVGESAVSIRIGVPGRI